MLSKKYRLTKNGSYSYLYSKGNRASERAVKLCFVKSKNGVKIGFSVSNKIGKAVVRNKVKRRMRAIVGEVLPYVSPCQAVFVAMVGVDGFDYETLRAQLLSLLVKAGLLQKENA